MGIAQLKCQECSVVVTSAEEQLCSSDGEQLPGKGSGERRLWRVWDQGEVGVKLS